MTPPKSKAIDRLPLEGIQIIVPANKKSNKVLIKNPEKFNTLILIKTTALEKSKQKMIL